MKEHLHYNQFRYACGSVLIALLILAAGWSWEFSSFHYALDDRGPLRIVVPLLLVTALAWMTDFAVDKGAGWRRVIVWYVATAAPSAFLALWGTVALVESLTDKYGTKPQLQVIPLLFFAVLIALFCVAVKPFKEHVPPLPDPLAASGKEADESTGPEDEEKERKGKAEDDDLYGRWGKAASLIIMVLALYAFGLHREGESGELKVRWEEVPAILIVFVLAELGVQLVVRARRIQTDVGQSSQSAMLAVKEAKNALEKAAELRQESMRAAEELAAKMGRIEADGTRLVDKLQKVSEESAQNLRAVEVEYLDFLERLAPLEKSGCYAASNSLYRQLGMDSLDYWKTITTFAQSWDPLAEEKPGTQKLLKVLFSSYVGDSVEKGSIRRQDNSIACITADAIFAEVSERWLEVMLGMADRESPLVVWAVTKLLPTEFALPGVWLGTDERGEKAPRVQSLERFISAVLRACERGLPEVEYRRVTVFDKTGFSLVENEAGGTTEKRSEKDRLTDSIENWMLWDPRVHQVDGGDDVFDKSEMLLRALLLVAYEKDDALRSERVLHWNELMKFFQDNLSYGSSATDTAGILPTFPAKDGTEVLLFQYEFPSAFEERAQREGGRTATPRRTRPGAVIGGSKGFLDHRFAWSDIPVRRINRAARELLKTSLSSGPKSARELLEEVGWQNVKAWYCQNLHTGQDAWWTVMDEKNKDYFNPLRLKWNGASVLTLDLLLIGRRDGAEIDWQGAAISNLSFDRTECTIQLIAKSTGLKEIGQVVEGLWTGRGGGEYGRWIEWPSPSARGRL